MNSRTWLAFACVQIAGIVAMHLGPDWLLVLGVALLFPVTGLYIFTGIHKLILIGDVRLAIVAVVLNFAAWQCISFAVRKLRHRTSVSR